MTRYIATRIAQGALVVLGAVIISFGLVSMGGNPVHALGLTFLSPEELQKLIHINGYDRPLFDQFIHYITSALQGDFGRSFRQPVGALTLVLDALPSTVALVVGTLAVTILVSVPLAVLSVLRRGSVLDRGTRSTLLVLQGLPPFWLAVVLVLIFSVELRWLPSYGNQGLTSYILPVAALSIPLMSIVVRLLRSELLDTMGMEFVTALRAKGLSERDIIMRHALRNALPPLVTFMTLQVGGLLGGTVIVEAVFGWPGLGTLLITSSGDQDFTVIQAIVVVLAVVYVAMNLIADLVVFAIDPRLRTQ